MNFNKLADWLQITGNVGIILGLILVAVQISQNSMITQLDMRSRSFELAMQSDIALMGENPAAVWAKATTSSEELTDEELTVIHGYLNYWWNLRERNALIQNAGLFEDANYNENYSGNFIFGGNPTSVAWWRRFEPYNVEEWTESVDQILAEQPEGFETILDSMKSINNQ